MRYSCLAAGDASEIVSKIKTESFLEIHGKFSKIQSDDSVAQQFREHDSIGHGATFRALSSLR
jgi:hypothetical protein